MSSKCPNCGKTVYFAEKVTALHKDYHKACFKCKGCNKTLEVGKFSDRDDQIYCKSCYGALFTQSGFGHGGSTSSFRGTGGTGKIELSHTSDGAINEKKTLENNTNVTLLIMIYHNKILISTNF